MANLVRNRSLVAASPLVRANPVATAPGTDLIPQTRTLPNSQRNIGHSTAQAYNDATFPDDENLLTSVLFRRSIL